MTDYRLYCLDGVGKIGTGEWIEATGDAEAIKLVRAKKLSLRCELWDHDRLVATIEPFSPAKVSPRADPAVALQFAVLQRPISPLGRKQTYARSRLQWVESGRSGKYTSGSACWVM